MSGKGMIQMTAERKSRMRSQVGFQIPKHASEWIQDWSKQLGIGSDNKTTCSLGIDKHSQGWWSRHLKNRSFEFPPNVKVTIPGIRMFKTYVEDTEPVPGLQVRSSTQNLE